MRSHLLSFGVALALFFDAACADLALAGKKRNASPAASASVNCRSLAAAENCHSTPELVPPLGQIWADSDAPIFDSLFGPPWGAGPWYTGPWFDNERCCAVWRYGFPGGHVPFYRGLGWRPPNL